MPTGSGKTAVMILLPYLLGSRRVLVVSPSKLLRQQIGAEFSSLRILRQSDAIAESTTCPRTKVVASRLSSRDAWEQLDGHDVIVGTPNVLSPGNPGVAAPPSGLFDLVIFDEAHHVPAPTYTALLEALPQVPAALFTATPFRRDRAHLPGRAVYTYSLGQALEDEILAPIIFTPIDGPDDWPPERQDETLAEAAVRRLRSPEHLASNSCIIARTASVDHAKELVEVYRRAGVGLGLITASSSTKQVESTLADLEGQELQGLISVGVLGEGFDFPRLKIAAYHRRHASLPATLQFLGRVTRLLPTGPPAELLAVREEVNDETRELYASDVSWATLLPRIADAAVQAEIGRRDYLRSFDPTPTEPLSLAALRPRKYVKIFDAEGAALDLYAVPSKLGDGEVIYHGVDDEVRQCVVITEHLDRPEWIDADTLDRYRYELHVVVLDPGRRYIFVHGTKDGSILELLAALGLTTPVLVDPTWIDRLMSSVVLAEYHSVGMRSARAAGGRLAAYRMMAGTNVGGAVLPSETRSYGTGHAIARVRDPMAITADMVASGVDPVPARITSLGVSYGRATVFSPDLAQLLDFREWCDKLAELVDARADETPGGLPRLQLLSPRRMQTFPEMPYAVVAEPMLLGQGIRVIDTKSGDSWPLELAEFTVDRWSAKELGFRAEVDGRMIWQATLDVQGQTRAEGCDLLVTKQGQADEWLAPFLTGHPLTVFYGTGESSMGPIRFQARQDYPNLTDRELTSWPFQGVDIRAESKSPRLGCITIKDYAAARLMEDEGVDFIVDDDRAGEIADLIAIGHESSGGARIDLHHCKYSSEDAPGSRVADLYEVLGQAARSVRWLDTKRLAERMLDRVSSGSKILYGKPDELHDKLKEWSGNPVGGRFSISVIQPGLRVSSVNRQVNLKSLISDVLEWVSQHDAILHVVGQ
jgi:Type III restriction enzyme, res subunit